MDFDPVESSNTGLELVRQLTHWDLGATVTYQNLKQGGACVTIAIPLAGLTALE